MRSEFVRELECELSEDEKIEQRHLAGIKAIDMNTEEEAEQRHKKAAKEARTRWDSALLQMRQHLEDAEKGTVYRPVDCVEDYDGELGCMVTKRLDTDETVDTRKALAADRQPDLDLGNEGAADVESSDERDEKDRKPAGSQPADTGSDPVDLDDGVDSENPEA